MKVVIEKNGDKIAFEDLENGDLRTIFELFDEGSKKPLPRKPYKKRKRKVPELSKGALAVVTFVTDNDCSEGVTNTEISDGLGISLSAAYSWTSELAQKKMLERVSLGHYRLDGLREQYP